MDQRRFKGALPLFRRLFQEIKKKKNPEPDKRRMRKGDSLVSHLYSETEVYLCIKDMAGR